MKQIIFLFAVLVFGTVVHVVYGQQQQLSDEQLCDIARRADAERLSRQIQRLQKENQQLMEKLKDQGR